MGACQICHTSKNNKPGELVKKKITDIGVKNSSTKYLEENDLLQPNNATATTKEEAYTHKDIDVLVDKFISEASALFGNNKEFSIENFKPDLSQNSSSLRRQIMINYLLQDIKDTELMSIIQNYLNDKLGSNSDYRNFLYLYEAPLINAGLHKYKSQLRLADKLGLNRNTLRKKIADNKNYL
jgi:DNA-binding protein Fis